MSLYNLPFSAFRDAVTQRLRDLLLVAAFLCACSSSALAGHVGSRLVVVGPEVNASFLEVADSTIAAFRAGHDVKSEPADLIYLSRSEIATAGNTLTSADYLVALGANTLEEVLQHVRARQVYAALVPYARAIDLLANAPSSVGLSIITAEQPDQRVTELFTLALKGHQRVGILYGKTSDARINNLLDEFASSELTLIPIKVYEDSTPALEIDRRHKEIDALLAIPDPAAVNSTTVRGVLQTGHRHGIPIVGYSQAFVDAGAIAAVFSSAQQVGQYLGELMAKEDFDTAPDKRLLWPRYFTVSLNEQIADSLGMRLESKEKIQTELEANGTKR